jgi:C4-dicarboxylate-specific signal transduction histidine kinase
VVLSQKNGELDVIHFSIVGTIGLLVTVGCLFSLLFFVYGQRSFLLGNEHHEIICIGPIIEEVLSICSQRLKCDQIHLKVSEYSAQTELYGCSGEIRQVLLNLIFNAMDGVKNQSSRWIHIDFKEENENLLIIVTDSGLGIPVESRSNLFRSIVSKRSRGDGLGLSVSKEIALQHKGFLELDPSSPHTRFIFTLPIRIGSAQRCGRQTS